MADPKKKKTLTEMAVGGGLFVLFLPLILFAIFWTIVAIGVGLLLTFVISDNRAALLPMVLVYGVLLAIMIFVASKFSARFKVLFQRLMGIIREQRRIRTLGMSPTHTPPNKAEAAKYANHDEELGESLRKQH